MKSLFVLLTLINFNGIMAKIIISNKATGGNRYGTLSYDNPSFKQALFSQAFIASSRNLFSNNNKEVNTKDVNTVEDDEIIINSNNNINYLNNKVVHSINDKFHRNIKSEGTPGKNKEGNVGYYTRDVGGVDVDLESLGHSLIDSYSPVNSKRYSRYTAQIPVQCIRINEKQLFCVHGNYIYKLKLPTPEISVDQIAKLVETVYREIEVKHIRSVSKIVKRETGIENIKHVTRNASEINSSAVKNSKSNVITFSLPVVENKKKLINYSEEDMPGIISYQKIQGITEIPLDQVPEKPDFFSEQNKPPLELSVPSKELLNTYSSKWLSKRQLNNKNYENKKIVTTDRDNYNWLYPSFILLKKRRIIPPKCYESSRKMSTKSSINQGKTGKCHRVPYGHHKCEWRTNCPCLYNWPKIPKETTCPPQPTIECAPPSTRCPACQKLTTEWWCTIEKYLSGINQTAPNAPKFTPKCTTETCKYDNPSNKNMFVTKTLNIKSKSISSTSCGTSTTTCSTSTACSTKTSCRMTTSCCKGHENDMEYFDTRDTEIVGKFDYKNKKFRLKKIKNGKLLRKLKEKNKLKKIS